MTAIALQVCPVSQSEGFTHERLWQQSGSHLLSEPPQLKRLFVASGEQVDEGDFSQVRAKQEGGGDAGGGAQNSQVEESYMMFLIVLDQNSSPSLIRRTQK